MSTSDLSPTMNLATVRADALFASPLQRSAAPDAYQIRTAVAGTLRRLGRTGCAAVVATEFGDHPETAVARMAWVRATVRATWPARPVGPARPARPAEPTEQAGPASTTGPARAAADLGRLALAS